MKRLTQLAAIAALLFAGSAQAALTYGNIGGPGVYVSNGVPDGDWTIGTDNGVQVALRAKDRQTFALIDGSSGVYQVSQGQFMASSGLRELWNYEFSVNLRADNNTTRDFSGLTVTMRVDTNPGSGESFVDLDVLGDWGDNEWWSGVERIGASPNAGEYGVQQSVNPLFSNSGFGFSPGPGMYSLELVVMDGQRTLSSVQTAIQVVPEPSGLALVGIALAGLGFAARRRKAS